MQSLCLHANSISKLDGLRMLRDLEDLNLSSNQLCDIEGLQTLTSLTSLNLASNRLSILDKLQPLSGLRSLNASYNTIEHLSELSALQVTDLAVYYHRHVLHSCAGKTSLCPTTPTFLHASSWAQRIIWACLCALEDLLLGRCELCCGLQALRKLDLRGNVIGSLRELAVLAGLPNLRELQLEGESPGNSVCAVPGYRYESIY